MIRVRDIDHLVLRVADLPATLAFYCGALGCTVERRRDDLGLVQLRAGRSLIDLVPVSGALGRAGGAAPGAEGRNLDHFCLRVEPYDEAALRRDLAAAGVAIGEAGIRYGAEGAGPSLYVTDPEGNTVELRGPPLPVRAGADSAQGADATASLAAEIEAFLVAVRHALDAEIRDYPTPIPRCDAQFNSLYEQRARVASELAAIAGADRSAASCRDIVDGFLRAPAFSELAAEAALRARAAATCSSAPARAT